jgi:hypothetical protein
MKYLSLLLALVITAGLVSCKQKKSATTDTSEADKPATTYKIADFNADTAYYFVGEQVKFGPRVPNTRAHANCANWLEKNPEKIHASGCSSAVYRQSI